ncbi:uncharacterized protein LOC112158193 [Oryzias melastigma]|uniref:uncharacterized protein LOC112158193 n=1 Tax=Oryzias melastigma TaxID=30732 RepID=UPI000CF7F3D4|nr:uncharacterized protein LOC112158193 [Oryzias melastigma]
MTLVLELMILLLLQFEGTSGKTINLYARAGDQVLLPRNASSSSHSCSKVDWLHRKEKIASEKVVMGGIVVQSSAGASRLSVSSDCSLLIRNIMDEDAGLYVFIESDISSFVYLNILSISPSPPDVHGNIKLQCSLSSLDDNVSCQHSSILWVDETGTDQLGEKADFESGGQKKCVSVLTVKHQRGNNQRLTCQFVKNNNVKIDAVYVPASTDLNHSNTFIITGAVVGVLLMMLAVVTTVLFKRRKAKKTEDPKNETDLPKSPHHNSELTYATVIHLRPNTSAKRTVNKEEAEVTYSAVRVK